MGRVGEGLIIRRGNAVTRHEGLGKIFGAFQLRRRLRRAKNRQARCAKRVHDARGQRRFGADHGIGNAFFPGKIDQRTRVCQCHVLQAWGARRAPISRGNVHRPHPRGLRQPPSQRMLAAAAANH